MAKKNQDQDLKKVFKDLSAEILRYGEEGRSDLEDIIEEHQPAAIFKLASGPDRSVRVSRLFADMREARADLAGRLGEGVEASTGTVRVSRIGLEYPGVYDGFRYAVAQLPNGKWAAKITRKGRQILEDPSVGAPIIVGNTDLNKLFNSQSEAENAVHRVIRRALIWYGERGISPREKHRKTEMGRAGIQRRTAGQVAERERQASEGAAEKREEARRSKAREARREERMHRLDRSPRTTVKSGSGRKLLYIPKKNPSSPFNFLHSESAALIQGKKSVQRYKELEARWQESLRSKNPDFKTALRAYDYIVNAASNFTIAEEMERARKAADIQTELRKSFIDIFVFCNRELSKKYSKKKSEDIAKLNMDRADKLWGQYNEGKKFRDLLAAYKHLEIARAEFLHDGDEESADKATTLIRLVKKEINNWTKK